MLRSTASPLCTTTPQNHFFPSVPHTYFATKFRTNFNFIEVFTDDKPDICATIIQNMLQHYIQDILDTLKFQLLMKNPNSSKLMILTF